MTDEGRAIELAVEVAGTPEEVWRAIATGPGISSWYVPHTVDEREGGAAVASFGPGMDVPGRVAAWDPPRRIVFDGGEGVGGFAFEWLVEARDGGTCIVRLVHSGFGEGEEWDDQYDAIEGGWKLFLRNLQLHLEHFRGRTAVAVQPMAMVEEGPDDAWARLLAALGFPPAPTAGAHVSTSGSDAPELAGTVLEAGPRRLTLLVDRPAPGTAFVAVESHGGSSGASVWSYLYDAEGARAAEASAPAWWSWLAGTFAPPGEG